MGNALVWGADGGIGHALVQRLVTDGWTTITASRSGADADGATLVCQADCADDYAVQAAVRAAAMEIDQIDLWVYCAGDIVSSRLADLDRAAWTRIMDANLTGVYVTLHASMPLLAEDAHIVIVGAVSERLRLPGLTAYVAAKAGLEAFVEALAKEERKRTVTLVRPGAVKTDFWQKVPFRMPAKALEPAAVAAAILKAHADGHKGSLDL